MSDYTDPKTGAVASTADSWAGLRARAEALRDAVTETPAQIDRVMRATESLGFEIADFLLHVNEERYAAEIAYSKRRAAAIAKHGLTQRSVTVAKALAEADAETEYAAWLAAKAIYHHVEDIGQALSRKHYGLMNTNKGIQGQVGSGHRRTT